MARKRKDGMYVRRGMVVVEMDGFQASLFAPEKLRDLERQTPGVLAEARDDVVEQWYIVKTLRHGPGGTWEVVIFDEENPQGKKYPGRVIDRIISQRESIKAENRSDSARDSANLPRVSIVEQLESELPTM